MVSTLIQAFRNLKMRSQIIFLFIMVLLLVLSLAGVAIYIEIKIFYYISERSSQNTLVYQDIKQISLTTQLVKRYIKEKHKLSISLVDHISSFLHYYTKFQKEINFQTPMDRCLLLDDQLNNKYILHTQKMCYAIYGNIGLDDALQESSAIKQLYNGLRLLDNFGVELYKFYPDFLQFVDISDVVFNTLYPFGFSVKKYNLKNRGWFADHIKKAEASPNQYYFFTDVYQMIAGDFNYYFSITQSLFDENKQFFGILKLMLTVDYQHFKNVNFNIILINQFGQVIFYNLENQMINNSQVFYIFNETITGFNLSDWRQIEDEAVKNQNLTYGNQNLISQCVIVYNKLYKSQVHLRSEKFEKENFTLIIFSNITSKQILQEQFDKAYIDSRYWIVFASCITVVLGTLSFSISTYFINVICKPLVEINLKISKHVLSVGNNVSHMILKIFQFKEKSSDIFTKLNEQMCNLYDTIQIKQQKKCEQCILIENMLYNKRESNSSYHLLKIAVKSIPDNEQVDPKDHQKFFQFVLKQLKVQEI